MPAYPLRVSAPVYERLLYAHRGVPFERPENTLLGFERAVALGADALELDVHVTRDGRVVVSHDATGARMAGVPERIAACSLAEVQSWDAGWGFVGPDGARPYAAQGIRMPTLDEVIGALPEVRLNVDIKPGDPRAAGPVVALVHRLGAADRVRLTSFSTRVVRRVRRSGYRGTTGLGRGDVLAVAALPHRVSAMLRRWELLGTAAQVPVRAGPVQLATRRFIDRCHALGIRVDFWTIDDPDEARRLLALGADGVVSNDAGRLAPVFRRARA